MVLLFFPKNKILIFTSGANRKKNKKEAGSRCDLGASIECEPLCKHSTHSDYWHRCYLLLFYFSSVTQEN